MDIWRQKAERLKDGIGPDALNKALEQYEQAIKLDSTDRRLRLNYARLLLEGKRNAPAAIAAVSSDYRADTSTTIPRLPLLPIWRGSWGDIDSALKHAIRAVEIMPTDPVANYTAGLGYQKKGQPGKGTKVLR